MAGYFKRRKPPGPSKNEVKVKREREQESRERSLAPLSVLYPGVERLIVRLEFLGPQQQPLGQETREFGKDDRCRLVVSCPGQCGVGFFNLEGKVSQVIESKSAVSESSGKCQEPLYAGASSLCGCMLKCALQVVYAEEPAPAPAPATDPATAPAPAPAPQPLSS